MAVFVFLVGSLTLFAGTGTAGAGVISYDGSTVVFTATDALSHRVYFELDAVTGEDVISDDHPITSYPGDCTAVDAFTVSCPGHDNVRVDFGSGSDVVDFYKDCFTSYLVNLGGGNNEYYGSDGSNCTAAGTATVNGGAAHDYLQGGVDHETLNGAGGDDSIYGDDGNDVLRGGADNDELNGGNGNDQVFGEGGKDNLVGEVGDDLLDGGDGDDQLEDTFRSWDERGVGADTYIGGAGTDEIWFDQHAPNVAISINGLADDGNPGERDNVGSDIETVNGSAGNDVFNGSDGPDSFKGGWGNDEMHGAGGADKLDGEGDDDRIFGDAGDDKLAGSGGADLLDGGAGLDELYGDIKQCSAPYCKFDADKLFARDGERDAVDCGGGADTAQVDQFDAVAFCAVVDLQNVVTAPPVVAPPVIAPPAVPLIAGAKVTRATRAAGLTLQVTLSRPATLSVKIERLIGAGKKAKRRLVGTVRLKAKAGRNTLRIKKVRGKRLRKGRHRLTITAPGTPPRVLTIAVR